MRVIHFIDLIKMGGAQKLLVTFAREAGRMGIETEVIYLGLDENEAVRFELEALGVPATLFSGTGLLDLQRLNQIVRYLKARKVDVIQTHLTYANIIGGLAGFAARVPVVATLHQAGLGFEGSKIVPLLEAGVMRYLDRRVIAVGKTIAEVHQPRLGPKHIDVITNAVDLPARMPAEERNALRRSLVGDENRLLFITVARLVEVKAIDDLLCAFQIIHQRYPQTALLIVGDGERRSALEALSRELGISAAVRFLGMRDDVARLLSASDVYISSSLKEGMPLAVMEAMAAHLPIISTAVGELSQMITEDYGFLAPPHRPELLAEAALKLLADGPAIQARGQNAYAFATKNFGPSAWMSRLTGLYREAAGLEPV